MRTLIAAALVSLIGAPVAFAQSTTAAAGPLPVTGNVLSLCTAGTGAGGDSVFGLGVLINTSTGFLLGTLAAPAKIVMGSFCNSQSAIAITATPMTVRSANGTPPPGFRETIPHALTASWAGVSTTSGKGDAVNLAAPDVAAGDPKFDIDIPGGGAPLIARTYSDLLVVELRVAS